MMARGGSSGSGSGPRPRGLRIEGEPDLASGTLEEWERYRRSLASLPQEDEAVRLAIAVAEARIATLRHAARPRGPRDRGRR